MPKRIPIIALCIGLMLALNACNTNEEKTAEKPNISNQTETEAPTDGASPEYIDRDAYFDVVADYILKEEGQYYAETDVKIPVPVIQAMDDSDKENIKIWADFILYGFNIEDDKLILENGGTNCGLIVLKYEGDTIAVTDYKIAEDGAGFDESLKEICEGDEALYNKFIYAEEYRKQVEHDIIRDYVKKNNIAVTSYQIGEEVTPID